MNELTPDKIVGHRDISHNGEVTRFFVRASELSPEFRARHEAALAVVEAARDAVDDDDCRFDHHGYCQTHGPGSIPCQEDVLRDALAEFDRRSGPAKDVIPTNDRKATPTQGKAPTTEDTA